MLVPCTLIRIQVRLLHSPTHFIGRSKIRPSIRQTPIPAHHKTILVRFFHTLQNWSRWYSLKKSEPKNLGKLIQISSVLPAKIIPYSFHSWPSKASRRKTPSPPDPSRLQALKPQNLEAQILSHSPRPPVETHQLRPGRSAVRLRLRDQDGSRDHVKRFPVKRLEASSY